VKFPSEDALHGIVDRTTQDTDLTVNRVVDGPEILQMRHVARAVPIARPVQAYAIRLTLASHPGSQYATPLVNRYVRYGASPRAAQALVLAAKIHALVRGQAFVAVEDIRSAALPALRHRLLLNFEGEADEVSTDTIVEEMLGQVSAG
jgi:MoxR-like ATPase